MNRVTPQLRELVQKLEASSNSAKLGGLILRDGDLTLALNTRYVFAGVPEELDLRDVDGIRKWFTASLTGMGNLLDLLVESPVMSAAQAEKGVSMDEQKKKMADEQLSPALRKSKGGRLGGKILFPVGCGDRRGRYDPGRHYVGGHRRRCDLALGADGAKADPKTQCEPAGLQCHRAGYCGRRL